MDFGGFAQKRPSLPPKRSAWGFAHKRGAFIKAPESKIVGGQGAVLGRVGKALTSNDLQVPDDKRSDILRIDSLT
jgi:hypothetical protein